MVFKSLYPDVKPPEMYKDSLGLFFWHQLDKHARRELFVDYVSGRTWTGAQIKSTCIRIASNLINDYGLTPGDNCAFFCLHNDYLHLLALSVVIAGCSVCFWAFEDPTRERRNIIIAMKPRLVFVETNLVDEMKNIRASTGVPFKIVVMDDDKSQVVSENPQVFGLHKHVLQPEKRTAQLPVIVPPDDPCYIIMTSGSTGQPKPLGRSHKNSIYLCHSLPTIPKLWHLHEDSVLSGHLPPDHGTGTFCIKATLTLGMKMIIMHGYEEKRMLDAIERYNITDIMLGSALLHNFMLSERVKARDISSILNLIAVGSPMVSHETAVSFMDENPNVSVRQAFGMTEAAFLSMVPRDEARIQRRTVGFILPNITMKLLDLETNEEITEFDKKGELYVASPTLASGYIGEHLKEQTKAAFQEDGFYRSFDMASISKDSQLTLYGRRNEILDLYDGWKVLPSEIEEYISRLPEVNEVAVIGIPSLKFPGCHDVRAFVSLKKQVSLTEKDIVAWVANGLSEPKHLNGGCFILESLPRTTLSKVDKKLLRAIK